MPLGGEAVDRRNQMRQTASRSKRRLMKLKPPLLDYNASAEKKNLLILDSAVFTFKTAVAGKAGASLNLYVFKLGASRERVPSLKP